MKQILFFLFALPLFSQTEIKGIVIDTETGNPIPYVNIWIENGRTGVTSEIDGKFSIAVEKQDNLVFSAMGFEPLTVKSSNAEMVKMKPVVFALDEIVIARPTGNFQIEIGASQKASHSYMSGPTPWIYAKYFPYQQEYSKTRFIKNAIVYTTSQVRNATFKLRIYEVKEDGFPGLDLIDQDIVVAVRKGSQKLTVDLSKFNLTIPKNGIFIAYEWMIIENNKYTFDYKDKNQKSKYVTYAPNVICGLVETENTYEYKGGRWLRRSKSKSGLYEGKVLEPAINLTLTN